MTLKGEMGYPSALTAKTWGFYDVLFSGKPFRLKRPYGSYVMENVLFKISFPAEFHAQTAVECAVQLHPQVGHRLDDIEKVVITTHESAIRIIDKKGPLHNPADRDHCIQYMTAIGLMKGNLTAADYEDAAAADPAHRPAAREDGVRGKQALDARLSRPREALDRQRGAGVLQGRDEDRTGRPSSTRSATAAAARRAYRCWRRSSGPISRAASRPSASRPYLELTRDQERLDATPVNEFVDLFAT